jgi:hypothetical protein
MDCDSSSSWIDIGSGPLARVPRRTATAADMSPTVVARDSVDKLLECVDVFGG